MDNEDLDNALQEMEQLLQDTRNNVHLLKQRIESRDALVEPEPTPTWMPSNQQIVQMREAELEVLKFMLHHCSYYTRDFTSHDKKWVPYFEITTGRWALQSVTHAISSPVLWHWPKPAWQMAIVEIPGTILKMMGVFYEES